MQFLNYLSEKLANNDNCQQIRIETASIKLGYQIFGSISWATSRTTPLRVHQGFAVRKTIK